jgi:hypothetical protein
VQQALSTSQVVSVGSAKEEKKGCADDKKDAAGGDKKDKGELQASPRFAGKAGGPPHL